LRRGETFHGPSQQPAIRLTAGFDHCFVNGFILPLDGFEDHV
jgi:hypothetical protein